MFGNDAGLLRGPLGSIGSQFGHLRRQLFVTTMVGIDLRLAAGQLCSLGNDGGFRLMGLPAQVAQFAIEGFAVHGAAG